MKCQRCKLLKKDLKRSDTRMIQNYKSMVGDLRSYKRVTEKQIRKLENEVKKLRAKLGAFV